MHDSRSAIRLVDACRSFRTPEGRTVTALDHIDLEVAANEFVTLLGPSGCGKTTLLRCISGLEDLDSGTLTIDGQVMNEVPANRRPVNTVFQSYALFPHMNVQDNIGFSLRVAGTSRTEIRRRSAEALAMVDLDGLERRMPAQLSGGQQQRVALARALVNRPRTLLLDEPLSALDRQLRQVMQLELKNLQTELGISFVFVTHDQEEALTLSDRIAVLDQGRVQQVGTPEMLYDQPANRFVANFIGESNLIPATVQAMDELTVTYRTASGLQFSGTRGSTRIVAGDAVTLLLRPEHLELTGEAVSTGREHAELHLILDKQVFVGSDHILICRSAVGQHTFRVAVRTQDRTSVIRPQTGDRFCVSYPLQRLHVLMT